MVERQGALESLEVNAAFWKGKRVLLTGHTGFKGSWLSLWLQRLGAQVTGLALAPPTNPSLFATARVAEGMASIEGDIRDAAAVERAFAQARPEIVLHMAAQPLVRRSYVDPAETYSTNVMGLLNVLEAARRAGSVRAMVNVTTDKCYENREWAWGYRENEALGGYDPYSSSKACAEILTASYRRSFFGEGQAAVATARAGNVIGGGDWAADRLVADIMRAVEDGEPVRIRNPHAIRPWQHVLEPLRGYLMLAERLHAGDRAFAEAWNFGPHDNDARPVGWIVEELVRRWGPGARYEIDAGEHPHEATYLKLDISKARAQLGWSPRVDLAGALDRIVAWYKAHQAQADMREVTLRQIADYEALAPRH